MSKPLEMLRSARDFGALQRDSKSRAHPLLILRWRRNELGHLRLGLSTGRRLGGAVVRNRVRRRLREAMRAAERRPPGGYDILLVCRPQSATATYAQLTEALDRLLQRMYRDQGGQRTR